MKPVCLCKVSTGEAIGNEGRDITEVFTFTLGEFYFR